RQSNKKEHKMSLENDDWLRVDEKKNFYGGLEIQDFNILEENQDQLVLIFTDVNFQIRVIRIVFCGLLLAPIILSGGIIIIGELPNPLPTCWLLCGIFWTGTLLFFIAGLTLPIIETLKADKIKGIIHFSGRFPFRKDKKLNEYMIKDIQDIDIHHRKNRSFLKLIIEGKKKVRVFESDSREVNALGDILRRNFLPGKTP
ncbi:MAG: hypothetical protein ACFFCS_20725, partial [Candidatus Hodarchaeota archaeon]